MKRFDREFWALALAVYLGEPGAAEQWLDRAEERGWDDGQELLEGIQGQALADDGRDLQRAERIAVWRERATGYSPW